MTHRRLFSTLLWILGSSLATGCGAEASDGPGASGGSAVGGHGTGGAAASGGSGTETGGANGGAGTAGGSGAVVIVGACAKDTDCLAVSDTTNPCFSPGCELPRAASAADVASSECLVPWEGLNAPAATDRCRAKTPSPVACALSCAAPPTCISPLCNAGKCELRVKQDGSDCESTEAGGSPSDCDALDQARRAALQAARSCIGNGIAVECAAGDWIPNECGCPAAVNDNQPTLVQEAQAARDAWNAACEPPAKCAVIDCAGQTGSATCVSGGNQAVCQFQ